MPRLIIVLVFSLCALVSGADFQYRKVDFLGRLGVAVNGAGPLLVKVDARRSRVILANQLTASVSIFTLPGHRLENIAIPGRILHYSKAEAMAVDAGSGNVYLVGDHALYVVFPDKKYALAFPTGKQYEMVAVDERNGNAFLVGREATEMAFFSLRERKLRAVTWCERQEAMVNLNATPPPPIRKVAVDSGLDRVFALDGFTSTLAEFSAASGKLLKKSRLPLVSAQRWHWAGYDAGRHQMLVAIETAERRVVQAARIGTADGRCQVIEMPGLTEGVGIAFHEGRQEMYIAYDNHPTVHVVDFKGGGSVHEIKIPAYGNDAAALDAAGDTLYVSSWAYGEVDQIDLARRRLKKRILGVGILPHMFGMAFHPENGCLYIPLGATAHNGTFGAALTVLEPASGRIEKIRSGWAPIDLVQVPGKANFLVFDSEEEAAEVEPDGEAGFFLLPCIWPRQALPAPAGHVYLSYGGHQSYWPVVYIWPARDGILDIDPAGRTFNDRRIPRLAQEMVLDAGGALYALQNSWGSEKQFLVTLEDEIRAPNQGDMRLELEETFMRETAPRFLRYDKGRGWLYVGRLAETDDRPGSLQVVDLAGRKVVKRLETGLTPVDLVSDDRAIYVANFADDTIQVIRKSDFSVARIKTGARPLKMVLCDNRLYWINHLANTLQEHDGEKTATYPLPVAGKPDNLEVWGEHLVITTHNPSELNVLAFSRSKRRFFSVCRESYPFGDTSFAAANCSSYQPGQFGDALYEISRIRSDDAGRLWISDFLSGKLFIVSPQRQAAAGLHR